MKLIESCSHGNLYKKVKKIFSLVGHLFFCWLEHQKSAFSNPQPSIFSFEKLIKHCHNAMKFCMEKKLTNLNKFALHIYIVTSHIQPYGGGDKKQPGSHLNRLL